MRTIPSIDSLARANGIPQWKLKRVLDNCTIKRQAHMFGRKGWSYDKGKTMLAQGQVPLWVTMIPEFEKRYFDTEMSRKDREKAYDQFYRDYPEFRTVA